MAEKPDPRRGGAYLVLNERFGPPMSCPSRERQAELTAQLREVTAWADRQEPEVGDAYRWSVDDYLRTLDEVLTQREAGEAARRYYEAFPRPPL